jgi:anaerobic C4-dicarboxylate transporter
MTKNNEISTSSKKIKKPYKCRNCYIIRLFLLAVVFLVLFALIQSENLHYLNFVTPSNAATLIFILGIIMFLAKVTKYFFEKKKH